MKKICWFIFLFVFLLLASSCAKEHEHDYIFSEYHYDDATFFSKSNRQEEIVTYVCTECNKTKTEFACPFASTGHKSSSEVEDTSCYIAPTCLTTGEKVYIVYCTTCGKQLSERKVTIEKLTHNIQESLDESKSYNATCMSDGLNVYVSKCLICGEVLDTRKEVVEKLGHNYVEVLNNDKSYEPTCVSEGLNVYDYKCSRCGDIKSTRSEIVKKIDHDFTITTTPPSCLERGYDTHKCNHCDYEYIDNYVDATGHTPSKVVIEDKTLATYKEVGFHYECIYCTSCNQLLSRTYVKDSEKLTGNAATISLFNIAYANSSKLTNYKADYTMSIQYNKSGLVKKDVSIDINGIGEKIGFYYNGSAQFVVKNNNDEYQFDATAIYPYITENGIIKTQFKTENDKGIYLSFNPIIIGKGIYKDVNESVKKKMEVNTRFNRINVSITDSEFRENYKVILDFFTGYINSIKDSIDVSSISFENVILTYTFENEIIKSCTIVSKGVISDKETINLNLSINYSEEE